MDPSPLASRLRPHQLSDLKGQEHLTEKGGLISASIEAKAPVSLILWGPPGCGKTTLARIYAASFDANILHFHPASGTLSEIKKWIDKILEAPLFRRVNIVFIDEIHRLNKAQQDALLPYIEEGTFHLIGATTENPSFELRDALLSRAQVVRLKPLSDEALTLILAKALNHAKMNLGLEEQNYLIKASGGDARYMLFQLQALILRGQGMTLSLQQIIDYLQEKTPNYDANGEMHYNLISALHKSIRASDPDAALYWLARMLQGGENPQYIARRLLRVAYEDIGLADPEAKHQVLTAWESFERLGSPEGEIALAEATVYLALCPKSHSIYQAMQRAEELAKASGHLSPPMAALNAPNYWMKKEGYGKGYVYDHDTQKGCSGKSYFPKDLKRPTFYEPKERGFEREMKKRLEYFSSFRES